MLVLDLPALIGIAALLTSLSALIWSVRRRPWGTRVCLGRGCLGVHRSTRMRTVHPGWMP